MSDLLQLITNLPEDIEFRSLQVIDIPNVKGFSVLLRKRLPPNTYRRGAYGLGQALTIAEAARIALRNIEEHVDKQDEPSSGIAAAASGLAGQIKINL